MNEITLTPDRLAMKNPWIDLPEKPPYLLESDSALVNAFNTKGSERYRFDLSLFPEPFFGLPLLAPVIMLNLNPGWSPCDAEVHARPEFGRMSRRSLEHQLNPYPFLHLQPDVGTPGNRWWHKRTRELVDDVGFEVVAQGLACIQYAPYHSSEYARSSPRLPSQEYGFELVRNAMARNAQIVVMRSRALWLGAIPELETYKHVHYASNPRAPFLSRGNLKSSYDIVVQSLRDNTRQEA